MTGCRDCVAARRTGLLLALLGLAGCAATPPRRPAATQIALPAPSRRAPAFATEPEAAGKPLLLNDPSASIDSPLCGKQAREANAIGASLSGMAGAGGVCTSFACYDPLTATYLGADGYRHVCR